MLRKSFFLSLVASLPVRAKPAQTRCKHSDNVFRGHDLPWKCCWKNFSQHAAGSSLDLKALRKLFWLAETQNKSLIELQVNFKMQALVGIFLQTLFGKLIKFSFLFEFIYKFIFFRYFQQSIRRIEIMWVDRREPSGAGWKVELEESKLICFKKIIKNNL